MAYETGSGTINKYTMRVAIADDSPNVVNLGSIYTTLGSIYATLGSVEDPEVSQYFEDNADATPLNVSSSSAKLYSLHVTNRSADDCFIQLFSHATTSITVGTSTPNQSYLIPAMAGGNYGAFGQEFGRPVNFGTSLSYAVTTEATNNTSPATGAVVNILYV